MQQSKRQCPNNNKSNESIDEILSENQIEEDWQTTEYKDQQSMFIHGIISSSLHVISYFCSLV